MLKSLINYLKSHQVFIFRRVLALGFLIKVTSMLSCYLYDKPHCRYLMCVTPQFLMFNQSEGLLKVEYIP
jgi:hypothetical protein